MLKTLPTLLVPVNVVLPHIKRFRGLSSTLVKFVPQLDLQLKQAEIEIDVIDFLSLVIFTAIYNFFIFFGIVFLISFLIFKEINIMYLIASLLTALVMSIGNIFLLLSYPNLQALKRSRLLEKDLLFAMRDLYIKLKSGIILYDALVDISLGDYGEVSKEFGKAVREMNAGVEQIEALEKLAIGNPSIFFRRIIWQIANAMRSGADIADTLNAIIANLSSEQRVRLRNFSSELNPLAMVYMMFTIIMPCMGITFIIILSSFSQFPITEGIFYAILLFLIFAQVMFMNVIKSRRPVISI
ncbi:MAG: type II secretion system F family protein [Candidatus Parvarchaeota archaeon]|nr:type II secretion system F family protein [Candidatus Jingweiarchaeum tengchongense]MCW1298337.1 type II secretion system F family protein [Candidatus Jingweiarchaeum tengchongense]MCW1300685.1 type II secretion system F family protein [Candidatus Jingweiarchaeum tengchongense]MCW1304726.1 type II secretion system F family protein [Candidatus Jingweiarchaeum tengchongense]MCW1306162.1 type II secretion system F family protein [Candidatus Jingweiarchaeum tengchongense]